MVCSAILNKVRRMELVIVRAKDYTTNKKMSIKQAAAKQWKRYIHSKSDCFAHKTIPSCSPWRNASNACLRLCNDHVKDPTISKMTLQQKVLEQKEFSAMVQIFHFASMSTGVGVALHLLSSDSSVQKKKLNFK